MYDNGLGFGGVLVDCEECYKLGSIDRSVVVVLSLPPPPLSINLHTKIQGMSSLAL